LVEDVISSIQKLKSELKEILENDGGISQAHYNSLMNKIDTLFLKIMGEKIVGK
jgi:broad-specificity NMP kinase